ncbi:hypothetical protein [Streptomyces sp. NPDC002889]|uniref:hypothetical protein n=1 Tax=Streptomyces sp. NPDC002889 TaxID=3364669 RepID=UPI00369EB301
MSGPLWQGPGQHGHAMPVLPRRREGLAVAADPMTELADRMEELIAAAVHPDEIAAILESDGMSDDHIRLRYGRPDSFTLAEELYARVPRRCPEPPGPPVDPWQVGLLGCLLRSLVFALPGLAYVLGAPLLKGAALAPLLAGALTGWLWNQALSHRAHSWLALGDRPAAALCLCRGAPAGALLGSLAAASAAALSADPGQWPAAAFATAQALYLAAATVLLALGRERALLYALLPMTAGAVASTAHDVPSWLGTALLLVSLVATTLLAARALRGASGPRRAPVPRPRGGAQPARRLGTGARVDEDGSGRVLGWPRGRGDDRAGGDGGRGAVPHVASVAPLGRAAGRLRDRRFLPTVHGLTGRRKVLPRGPGRPAGRLRPVGRGRLRAPREAAGRRGINVKAPHGSRAAPRIAASVPYGVFGLGAGLLVLCTALGDVLAGRPGAVVAAPSAVALTLGMGPAEWLLHRFRGETLAGLRVSATARDFWRNAAAVLAECLVGYLAVLFALAVAGTLLWPAAPALGGVRLATLLLIGTTLWTGLLLQSFGAVTGAAAVCGAAALAQGAALLAGVGSPALVGLCVAAVAAALLATLVCALLGRASAHRV